MAAKVITAHDHCRQTCPVSYYMINSDLIRNLTCMKCGNKDKLWLCIYCGHIGCGHTVQSHAVEHYHQTAHRYAFGLQAFLVWDYKAKRFLDSLDKKDEQIFNNFHRTCRTGDTQLNCPCTLCQHNRVPKLVENPLCMTCGECDTQNLWICLCCRYIGCSRYKNRHALQHYTKTNHRHTMQLENFSVWSYSQQIYIHGHARYNTVIRLPNQSQDH